jgi:hypothetical protein
MTSMDTTESNSTSAVAGPDNTMTPSTSFRASSAVPDILDTTVESEGAPIWRCG